jgi:hypothetical protein
MIPPGEEQSGFAERARNQFTAVRFMRAVKVAQVRGKRFPGLLAAENALSRMKKRDSATFVKGIAAPEVPAEPANRESSQRAATAKRSQPAAPPLLPGQGRRISNSQ